jgi:hypothetical protein
MNLPPLISFEDFPGADSAAKWPLYVNQIYDVFCQEVAHAKLSFRGLPIKCRYEKPYEGKHASFWHLMSEGQVEEDRTPDLARCARIPWIAEVIRHADDLNFVRCLDQYRETSRGRKKRVALWVYKQDYAIILEPRENCCFLITTYCVRPGQKLKFEKEWRASNA